MLTALVAATSPSSSRASTCRSVRRARGRTKPSTSWRLAWTKDHFSYKGKWTQVENLNVLRSPSRNRTRRSGRPRSARETVGHYAKKGIPFITDPLATFGRCKRAPTSGSASPAENGHDVSNP